MSHREASETSPTRKGNSFTASLSSSHCTESRDVFAKAKTEGSEIEQEIRFSLDEHIAQDKISV